MNKIKHILLVGLLLCAAITSYCQEYKSFEEALLAPEKVEKLTINFYNKQPSPTLPDERIQLLVNLKELSYKRHTDSTLAIPSEIVNLKQLKKIEIWAEEIPELPDVLFDIESLEQLTVLCYSIAEVPTAISKLSDLTELYITATKADSFPSTLWDLENLQHLKLSSDMAATLPPGMGKLKKLKSAVFHLQNLVELPTDIGQCLSLERLDINSKSLADYPQSISSLKNLKDFRSAQSSIFPKEICSIASLEQISLGNNSIQSVPTEVENLINLKRLSLSSSKFKRVPTALSTIPNLEYLDISYGEFDRLPHAFANMKSLKNIDLSYNKNLGQSLHLWADVLNKMTALEWVNVEYIGSNKSDITKLKSKRKRIKYKSEFNSDYGYD